VGHVLLNGGVADHAHVVVHVEAEQRAGLAARLGHNKVVECVPETTPRRERGEKKKKKKKKKENKRG
jgi:hypothetical protein